VPWFRARGWSTLLIDLRGHGASGGDQTSLGWHEAEDAAAAVAELRQLQDGPVVVYGFSMGAAAALRAASLKESGHPDGIIAEASFGELSSAVEARFGAMGLPAHPLGELLLFWGGVQAGFWPWSLAPAQHAASVTAPTLVIQGRQDPRVSLEEAERICAALAQRCRPLWVEGMGHEPLHEHSPRQWDRAASALLAEVLAGASGR
jgi:alpha-beta hydrolase superfamily lysophospholipase